MDNENNQHELENVSVNKDDVQSVSSTDQSVPKPKDTVREQLANFYVRSFICIIAGTLIILFWCGYSIQDVKDVMLAISGILSGPLGFIIGFYFKEEINK